MKSISILIVTHNSDFCIEPCLNSIFNQNFKDYEVIIIDNASEDGTRLIIKDKYPSVMQVKNASNLGVCAARNQGIAKAEGKFILCLDHDARLLDNFLVSMYRNIEGEDNVGAVGPKILLTNAKTIYSTGIYRSWLWRYYDIGSKQIDRGQFQNKKYVFGISAAAALYRKEALETIKQGNEYFDEDFFCIAEDIDVSWRLQKKGWKILYCPEAECIHIGGISRKKSQYAQYLSMKNRYLMMLKNESFLGFIRFPIVFLIYDLWRNLFMFIVNPYYFLKAKYEIIRLFPRMINKRRMFLSDG